MNIIRVVRVINGREILPDGSTLEEQGIIGGSTVNIIIEPDKEINLNVKLGPIEIACNVLSSMRMGALKQQLIDGGSVGFDLSEFSLVKSTDENDGISLQDDSLPLHLHGVSDNATLKVIGLTVRVHLVTHRGQRFYKSLHKAMTINQMKQYIRSVKYFFHFNPYIKIYNDPTLVADIVLFVQRGEYYSKLEGETPIGTVLSNNDVVHFIEDRFFSEDQMIPVYHGCEEIGRVGWSTQYYSREPHAYDVCDSVLNAKLRVQDQLGFSVSCVDVKQDGGSLRNDQEVRHISQMKIYVL